MAANIFTGATNSNWGTATNWTQGTVPTSTDGHITTFDATSPNCTVNTTDRGCNGIDFSAYTNTITMSFNIIIYGDCTLGAGMTIAGTGNISSDGTAVTYTWTSNGKIWPNNVTLSTGPTAWTFADDWTISGDLITATITINGSTLYIGGNFVCGANTGGTTAIVLNGTGTWTGGTCRNNLTINTTGTITISGTVGYNTSTLTYTAGTVVTTGSTLSISASTTLDTDRGATKITWNNVTLGATLTLTLTTALNISGTFIPCTGGVIVTINTSTVNISGNLSVQGTGGIVTGTSLFNINGTGTWSHTSTTTLRNNLTINTAGTLTVSGTVYYNTGTLTYTAGTMSMGTSILLINGSCTLNTNGILWYRITLSGASITLTLTSDLNLSNTFNTAVSGASTINGFNINCGTALTIGASGLIGIGSTVFVIAGICALTTNVGPIKNSITIKSTATVTCLGTSFYFNTGTFTIESGATYTSTGTTMFIQSNTTLDTNSVNINAIQFSGTSQTYTLLSQLNITTLTLSIITAIAFAGTSGFSVGTFSCANAGVTITIKSAITYTINTSFTITGTSASRIVFVSSIPGSQAILTLTNNGTSSQDLDFCNATDINSSAGLTIWFYKGVLSNATNWAAMPTQRGTVSYAT